MLQFESVILGSAGCGANNGIQRLVAKQQHVAGDEQNFCGGYESFTCPTIRRNRLFTNNSIFCKNEYNSSEQVFRGRTFRPE